MPSGTSEDRRFPILTGASCYGASNATVRARLLDWVDHLRLDPVNLLLADRDPTSMAARARSHRSEGGPVIVLRNAAKCSRGGLERRLLRSGSPGIYDLDDGLPWDKGDLPGLGAWWKRPWPRALIARRAAEAADRVVAGNAMLAKWAAGHCRDVVVVPTCVEPTLFARKTRYEITGRPTIGWIGSAATETYLLDVAPALAEVHRRTGARLVMMSAPGPVPPPLVPFCERVDWTLDAQHRLPATWDVGIMPLRNGLYERAKCAYKLLQYGASGLPMVGSPVGASADVLAHSGNAMPAKPDEWVDALIEVIGASADRRARLGAAGADLVAHDYSYRAWAERWANAVGVTVRGPRRSAGHDG